MKKKYAIALALVCLAAVLWAGFTAWDGIRTRAESDRYMERLMQAIAADPEAVTVKDGSRDVTESFFTAHLSELQDGDYQAAISEIRDRRYSLALRQTPRNLGLLQGDT